MAWHGMAMGRTMVGTENLWGLVKMVTMGPE